VTTPADYPSSVVASLWGGVQGDIQQGVVDADLAALTAAQGQAEDAEGRRRELAGQRPGRGAQIPLPQPPAAAGVGLADVVMPVQGEGYDVVPPVVAAVSKSYGPDRPQYADSSVGGYQWQPGRQEAPISMWIGQRSAVTDGVIVATAPPRPSLWSRLFRRGRR